MRQNILRHVVTGVHEWRSVFNDTRYIVLHNMNHLCKEVLEPRTHLPKVAGLRTAGSCVSHHKLPDMWTLLTQGFEVVCWDATSLIQPHARILSDVPGKHLHLWSHRSPVSQSVAVLCLGGGVQPNRGEEGWDFSISVHVVVGGVLHAHLSEVMHAGALGMAGKHVQAHPRETNVRTQHPASRPAIIEQPQHEADNVVRARNPRRMNQAAQGCPVLGVWNKQSSTEGGSTADMHFMGHWSLCVLASGHVGVTSREAYLNTIKHPCRSVCSSWWRHTL